ncbi:M48 family metallopeptidase [Nitrosococcus wardiae]|uniref:M48 family peptidase n=1 Tax=Nitrosococcus wardiae TaxID=1814290 RepID=A0A4P7C383_9GAMM|nr:SprT family zinc-dependent metalloprotease [Nitrosococcus wardiae]QBQ56180.1 M48 family peptidase [Nitrosococcus wardiae]
MNTKRHFIEVSGLRVEVVRKAIKNLHLGVYPPVGRVRVAAPLRVDDEAVRLAVISKLGWIRRQQARFLEQPRQSPRQMVTGESHYFQGRRYRLHVVEENAAPRVQLKGNTALELYVRPGSDATKRRAILNEWYRRELKALVPNLIIQWEPVIGVQVAEWGVKKMKTKWGTCNIAARRVWLNLDLAKHPFRCLEYILVHEMVHLLERYHNDRFRHLMDQFLPSWRLRHEELNQGPLAHEHWD